jgi:hypothetical protein
MAEDDYLNFSEGEMLSLLREPLETSCQGIKMKQTAVCGQLPCEEGFKPGQPHIQNKFCSTCREGFAISGAYLRCIPPELLPFFTNTTRAGFWNMPNPMKPQPLHQVPYRVINQHLRCQGPPMICFQGPPPALDWAHMPEGVIRASGEVWLRVNYGTLVPIVASSSADEKLRTERPTTAAPAAAQVMVAPVPTVAPVPVPVPGPVPTVLAVYPIGENTAQKRSLSEVEVECALNHPRNTLLHEAQRAKALAEKLQMLAEQHIPDVEQPPAPGNAHHLSAMLDEVRQESVTLSCALSQIAGSSWPRGLPMHAAAGMASPTEMSTAPSIMNGGHMQPLRAAMALPMLTALPALTALPILTSAPAQALPYSSSSTPPTDLPAQALPYSCSPLPPTGLSAQALPYSSSPSPATDQASVPPSPPATPLTAAEDSREFGLQLSIPSPPMSTGEFMDPTTLCFYDLALEKQYLGEVTRSHAGTNGVVINGSIVGFYLALIAKYIQDGEADEPCRSAFAVIAKMVVPCTMAAIGMLSHLPVGRTTDAYFEHRFLVWCGGLVMPLGVVAWVVTAAQAIDSSCPTYRANFEDGLLYQEPELVGMCIAISAVIVALNVLSFPFLLRMFVAIIYLFISLLMPSLSPATKYDEVAFFWPWILLSAGSGHLVESMMRIKFLARHRLVHSKARLGKARYPLLFASCSSIVLTCVAAGIRHVAGAEPNTPNISLTELKSFTWASWGS